MGLGFRIAQGSGEALDLEVLELQEKLTAQAAAAEAAGQGA